MECKVRMERAFLAEEERLQKKRAFELKIRHAEVDRNFLWGLGEGEDKKRENVIIYREQIV